VALPTVAIPSAGSDTAEPSRDSEQESLVVQTSFLGDAVLTTPLIAELAQRGPVDVVVTPAAAPLLANNPSIRTVIAYDKRGASGIGGLWSVARQLRASSVRSARRPSPSTAVPRVAYLAQQSPRSGILAILGGYHERVGFAGAPGRRFYTRTVPYLGGHHVERLLRLADGDGSSRPILTTSPSVDRLRPRLYPGFHEKQAVSALLREAHIDGKFVALAPGSVWGSKRWPYFAGLAAQLVERAPVIIVGGPDDVELSTAIVSAAGPRATSAAGKLSLLASAELIGRAAVLVTNDSSPQHLASAMGTPTITIFGPTVPTFGFGPLAHRSATVGVEDLPCRPCHHHGPPSCPLGHWRCMRDLGVERVLALVTSILT